MKKIYYILLGTVCVYLFSGCTQINRDNLRYGAIERGYEIYRVDGKDSLATAKEHSADEINLYENRLKIYKEYLKPFQCSNKEDKQETGSSNEDGKSGKEKSSETRPESQQKAMHPSYIPTNQGSSANQSTKAPQPPSIPPNHFTSQIEYIWPKEFLTDNKSSEELIKALSSTASVAQMRDLLTEPSFPPLLPVERKVNLGCLPPPESAAFEAAGKISAALKEGKIDAQVATEFASSVVKLFEESERTLFLQYALFRLCEMSVNSPAEFRNVYPVIIHDIVRRTAEMTQESYIKQQERLIEQEKTKHEQLKTEQEQLKRTPIGKDVIYSNCINSQLKAGLSDLEKIKKDCKDLVNSKPE